MILSDGIDLSTYTFNIVVTNPAPAAGSISGSATTSSTTTSSSTSTSGSMSGVAGNSAPVVEAPLGDNGVPIQDMPALENILAASDPIGDLGGEDGTGASGSTGTSGESSAGGSSGGSSDTSTSVGGGSIGGVSTGV